MAAPLDELVHREVGGGRWGVESDDVVRWALEAVEEWAGGEERRSNHNGGVGVGIPFQKQ